MTPAEYLFFDKEICAYSLRAVQSYATMTFKLSFDIVYYSLLYSC